jgi:hypothetical protein
MKRFILFLVMFLVVGCGIFKKVQYVPVETKRDSILVEKLVKDTVSIEIPGETVYVVAQDSSHLETKWSVSDAKIDSTGRLHHSLTNKDIKIDKEIVYKEIEKRVEVEKEVPVEVEVKVPYVPGYYKWINIIFWCLVGGFVIFIVFKIKS